VQKKTAAFFFIFVVVGVVIGQQLGLLNIICRVGCELQQQQQQLPAWRLGFFRNIQSRPSSRRCVLATGS
jgi:hypothetical protein